MITEKHLVLNALSGQYTYLESKADVAPLVVQYALELYRAQTNNLYYRAAFVDEHNHEFLNENGDNGTEIPADLLNKAIKEIDEIL